MTVTVSSQGAVDIFDQPDTTFEVFVTSAGANLLNITSEGNVVATFAVWESVVTDAFDPAAPSAPATTPAAGETPPAANPAPPAPTPIADEPPVAPPTTGVPDAPVAPEKPPEAPADAEVLEAPLGSLPSDVVIPAMPGGVTIGSPGSSQVTSS